MQALRTILVQVQQGVRSFRPEDDTPTALKAFQATAKRLKTALDRNLLRDVKFRESRGRDDYGSILSAIVIGELTLEGEQFLESTTNEALEARVRIFISHSSADAGIAEAFVNLLRAALNLPSHEIRCTSVDGFKLPIGTNVNEHLRREVHEVPVLVALLSPTSVQSAYVLFELGARWGSGNYLAPVTVGSMRPGELPAPLSATHAVDGANVNDLHQLISELARRLQVTPEGPNVYAQALQNLQHAMQGSEALRPAPSVPVVEQADEATALAALLSPEASALLLEASRDPGGTLLLISMLAGRQVQAGKKQFGDMNDRKSLATWEYALQQLQTLGLVELVSSGGKQDQVLEMVQRGYEVANALERRAE